MGDLSLWTVAKWWVGVSYLLAIVLAVDQLRRPRSEWEAAGRKRGFWVALSVIMSLHGLGQYAAAAYVVGVVPRFHHGEPGRVRLTLERWSSGIASAWWRVGDGRPPAPRAVASAREFAWVAAALVFAASFIHSIEAVTHASEHWSFAAFFAIVASLQAVWAGAVFAGHLGPRVLLAGALGNAVVVAVWVLSRTVGPPLGPDAWEPEPVGVVDTLCAMDEVLAIVLICIVAARLSSERDWVSSPVLRLSVAVAGPLFIYSLLAPFGGSLGH